IATRAAFDEVLADYLRWRQQFLDDQGELKPRFRPPPLVASFMDQVRSAECGTRSARNAEPAKSIPVPKGPAEVW
ncbi:MAG: tRNA dihydrouridine synthase DusB, partial [Limisphaerales bacterium]